MSSELPTDRERQNAECPPFTLAPALAATEPQDGSELFRSPAPGTLHRNAPKTWSPFFGSHVPFSVLFRAVWCSTGLSGKLLNRNGLSLKLLQIK